MKKAEMIAKKAERVVKLANDIQDDYAVTIQQYLKNAKGEYNWLFSWKGGGFNDVWAKTKEQAIAKAKTMTTKLEPAEGTFRKATRDMADAQNRAGNMLSM